MKIDNSLIMAGATLAAFILLALLIFFPVPVSNKEMLIAFGGVILGFFFGSSMNKNRKEAPSETIPTSDIVAAP